MCSVRYGGGLEVVMVEQRPLELVLVEALVPMEEGIPRLGMAAILAGWPE